MKFYKRDPDRALSGMAELTLKQRGAYNSLLDLLYSRDGDVPDDDARVARMISCHWREWAKVKAELMALGKVWSEGGKLRAKRVQETITEAADFAQEQSRRAAKGWQKRKKDNENNDPVMPPGNANTATATPIDRKRGAKAPPKKSPTAILGDLLGETLAADVVAHRQRIRKPLTDKAATLLRNKLAKCADPAAGAEMMIERGWQGFEPEWMDRATQQRSKPNDRLARLVNRLAPDSGEGTEGGSEVAGGEGDDLPQPLFPARAWG